MTYSDQAITNTNIAKKNKPMPKSNTKSTFTPIVSINIPAYHEENYIIKTLTELSFQTVWPQSEVVIAEYDPDKTSNMRDLIMRSHDTALHDALSKDKIRIVGVPRRGIGYARDTAARNSRGHYIVCFDADSRFLTNDSIYRLVNPISLNQAVMTHCQVLLEPSEVNPSSLTNVAYSIRNVVERYAPFVPIVFEQGLTFPIDVYSAVGGFRDVNEMEGWFLALDVSIRYGYKQIKMIDDVTILTSARRDTGLFLDLNYGNAYRGGQGTPVT